MFLEIRDLKKSYGEESNRVDVLKGINFSVEKGEICVLLGPVSYTHLDVYKRQALPDLYSG